MKNKLILIQIIIIVIALGAVTILYSAILDDQEVLVKIQFNKNSAKAVKAIADISPIVEMQGYIVAVMERKNLQKLGASKINFTILLSIRDDYSYYLVRYASSDTLVKIRIMGKAFDLEPGIVLFAHKRTTKAPLLPRDTMLRSLPLRHMKLSRLISPAPQLPIPKIEPIPEVAEIISKVSSTIYSNDIVTMQNFATRYYNTQGCTYAGQFIYDSFSHMGLDVAFQQFPTGAITSRNVIATQQGQSDPESYIIISGHYDSYSSNINDAPGADDNASGTSAVLEAARILSKYNFDFTIRYIAFDAEEIGLDGSAHYASNAASQNQRIIAVINLDMIAYVDIEPEDIDVVSNPRSKWLGDFFASTTSTYTALSTAITVNSSFQWSDHAPFWQENYSAITAIEDVNVTNPHYHTPSDRVNTLTIPFAIESTKAMLANAILLSQLYDPNLPKVPSGLSHATILNQSLFEQRKHMLIDWQPNSDSVIGYNVYRTATGHSAYAKLNSQPIIATHFEDLNLPYDALYYYVITAVSPSGAESHPSMEISDY